MIVKDEAKALPRLFDSCRELIDYWVICDTGSTDGTQDLIRRELDGIPGKLRERTWVNFGHNRSELMRLASGCADYLLLLDADMTVTFDRARLASLSADSYLLRHAEPVEYWIKRLVRGNRDWRYVGSTHEYIATDGPDRVEKLDAIVVHHHADGGTRSEKFTRDLALLSEELSEHPDDARALFYLAQTHRDLGHRVDAIELYERRAAMGGWEEEIFYALFQVGVLAAQLDDWPRAMDAFVRAWEIRPQRLEAVHALVAGLRERSCHQTAHRLARMAANLKPLPVPDDLLFVTPWVYEWGMLFEYSITAYWVGEYRNSMAACKRLLKIEALPAEYRELTIANLKHAVRETIGAATQPPPPPRRIQHVGRPTRGVTVGEN